MHIEYLSEFADLANSLCVSDSAKNLNVSQSTLSRHIQCLERELGASLFERSNKGVVLTEVGYKLYEQTIRMQDTLRGLSDLSTTRTEAERTVLVSGQTLLPSVNLFYTRMAMLAKRENIPVRFKYRHTHSFSDENPPAFSLDLLKDGKLDFAIETMGEGSKHFDTFDHMELYRERLIFCTSPDNALSRRGHIRAEDLEGNINIWLQIFPKTDERSGATNEGMGFEPTRIGKKAASNFLDVPYHLADLAPDEIVQFPASIKSLLPLSGKNEPVISILDVEDNKAYCNAYLFWRKDADRQLVEQVVALAREVIAHCKGSTKESGADNILFSEQLR